MSRFGVQPAREKLRAERWSLAKAADKLNIPPLHLRGAVMGRVVPSPALRDRLPALLGSPLSELFSADALAATYQPEQNAYRNRESAAWSTGYDQ